RARKRAVAPAPNPKAFSHLGRSERSGTGPNFNFSVDVGAADPTLRIIVGYSGNAMNRAFSSGTLDGVSLGIVSDGSNAAELVQASNATAGLLIAHLPSSSGSVTFDFNWSGAQDVDRTGFSFWRYTGDGITSTAIDVDKQNLD